MKKRTLTFFFIFITSLISARNIQELIVDLNNKTDLPGSEIYDQIKNFHDYPVPAETGVFLEDTSVINDTLNAPFVYYIPADYDPVESKPLLVYLHGLVGIPNFREAPLNDAKENYFTGYNTDEWFLLYPSSNIDCMWWDLPGTRNLEYQIRFLKNQFNIDDDRIYVTGFSDGGSGSFHLALNNPDDYASFYPLNGMLSVGQAVNGLPVYVPNMMNRYSLVINTDLDGLYPAEQMRKVMTLALSAGADIFYKEYWGIGHDFAYADEEIPIILAAMETHPRDPFRQEIYWETSLPNYGKCDWIEIVELDTLAEAKEWHVQHNTELLNNRMSFGFYSDWQYEGPGAKVTGVVENSAVAEMGIEKGDVILAMDGEIAADINALTDLRDRKQRGDSFTLTVIRGAEEITLKGRFPDPEKFQVFNYSLPSGAVQAKYYANQFHLQTSRIGEIAIYIHPEMVNLDIPVKIYINGELEFNEKVSIDRDFLIGNFISNLDRNALWVKRIILEI